MTGHLDSIDAVAWDIDGTLIDSEPLHHRALIEASRGFGVDLSELPDMAFRGVHMHDVWAILRPRLPRWLDRDVWLAAIEAAYVSGIDDLRPNPEAVPTILALAERGNRQVAVSNSARGIVDANLTALGIARVLEFSVSLDDVAHGKPAPEPYALAATRLGLAPHRILAVEDSDTGLASARAAGLRAIAYAPAVPTGAAAQATIACLIELVGRFGK